MQALQEQAECLLEFIEILDDVTNVADVADVAAAVAVVVAGHEGWFWRSIEITFKYLNI